MALAERERARERGGKREKGGGGVVINLNRDMGLQVEHARLRPLMLSTFHHMLSGRLFPSF